MANWKTYSTEHNHFGLTPDGMPHGCRLKLKIGSKSAKPIVPMIAPIMLIMIGSIIEVVGLERRFDLLVA